MVGAGRRFSLGLYAGLVAMVLAAGPVPVSASVPRQSALASAVVPTPCDSQFHAPQGPPQAPGGGFRSMAATSPNDIWAAGGNTGPQGNGAELLHWDGTAWGGSGVPASMTGGVPTSFTGVTTVPGAAGTVWAVGQRSDTRYPAYAARWDGTTWIVDNLPFIGYTVLVNAIAAMAPNDVWAVGEPRQRARTFAARVQRPRSITTTAARGRFPRAQTRSANCLSWGLLSLGCLGGRGGWADRALGWDRMVDRPGPAGDPS